MTPPRSRSTTASPSRSPSAVVCARASSGRSTSPTSAWTTTTRTSIVRYGGRKKGKLTPPKNGKTRRIELFGRALEAARAWLENPPGVVQGEPARSCVADATRLLPSRDEGPPRMESPTRKGTRSYLEIAGLHDPSVRHDGRPVRWHDLRHTCGASLISGRWGRRWSLDRGARAVRPQGHQDDAALRPPRAGRAHGGGEGDHRPHLQHARDRLPDRASARNDWARHRGFEPLAFGSGVGRTTRKCWI